MKHLLRAETQLTRPFLNQIHNVFTSDRQSNIILFIELPLILQHNRSTYLAQLTEFMYICMKMEFRTNEETVVVVKNKINPFN